MFCSRVQVKKEEEESEDNKIDIKIEHKSSLHSIYSSSSSCTAYDRKPVIIKHEIKKEEYDSDCDCNDCRVGQGKVIKTKRNDGVLLEEKQTDKHDDDCGCNDCVQDFQVDGQVAGQVIDQANQGSNDPTIGLTDGPIGDDASRSSTPDWMPSIFSDDDDDEESDDDATENDDKTTQDEMDDDDNLDFTVNDKEELQNVDDDHSQEESDSESSKNETPEAVKRRVKERKRKPRSQMEAKFKCLAEGCTKAFKCSSDLKRHNSVHTGERPFPCKQCKLKFSQKGELKRHVQNVHQKTKQWRCSWPRCKMRGGYWFNMVTHVKAVHFKKSDDRNPGEYIKKCDELSSEEEEECETRNGDESKTKSNFITVHLNCLDCSKTFKTRDELKGHLLKAHRIEQFRCLVKDCSASFDNKKEYLEHRSVKHCSCRVWPCRECGSEMSSYHNLSSHFRLQHQKGLFVCAYTGCTVQTDTIRDMGTHTLAHKPATHQCSGCNKRFKARKDLLTHERMHTGERPFACAQCDKRFNTNQQLQNHIRAHHQSVARTSKGTNKRGPKGSSNKKKKMKKRSIR